MPSELATQLRRHWWAPLLFIAVLDLAAPLLTRLTFALSPALAHAAAWIPFGLYTAAMLGLLALVWPELPEGGPEQVLLACQAALPILMALLGRYGLFGFMTSHGFGMESFLVWYSLRPLGEAALLAGAFHLRARDPETGPLSVAASAGLAILGGGWEALGLGSLLALLWKDPLPSELCGGEADPQGAARRASLAGFLMLLASPFLAILPYLISGRSTWKFDLDWITGPALVLAALSWTVMAARLGREGKVWRVLTWVSLGAIPLLLLALVLLLLSFSHGKLF